MKQKLLAILIFLLVFAGSFSLLYNLNYPADPVKNLQKPRFRYPDQRSIQGPTQVDNQAIQEGVLVTRVIDGDTIEIEGGQKVRYIGIDTPETVDPRTTVQCFGREAAVKNRELVKGKKVRLEKDISETDKYGRLLRYVYVGDVFVNKTLVAEGYAFSSPYPPDIRYQVVFDEAEKFARENNKGLWVSCGFIAGTRTTEPATGCVIKGNISSSGERIYHLPGQRYYNQTVIDESKGEQWFCSEDKARVAGWRKSKV